MSGKVAIKKETSLPKVREPLSQSFLPQVITHVLPFLPTRKRKENVRFSLSSRWGKVESVEVRARETLNAFDLKVLLGVTKVFLDNPLKDGGEYRDSEGRLVRKMYVTNVSRYKFLKSYLGLTPSTPNRRLVDRSLERLSDCTWKIHYRPPSQMVVEIKMLMKVETNEKGEYLFWVNANYIDKLLKRKDFLRIIINYINRCKTDTGILLAIWLQGQKGNRYREETLLTACHLDFIVKKPYHARELLRKGLDDLVQAGFLTKWEKTGNGLYILHRHNAEIIGGDILIPCPCKTQ